MSLTVTNMINFVLVIDEEMRKHKMCFSENGIDKYEILRILPCVKELQIAVKNDSKRTHTVREYEFNEFKSFDEASKNRASQRSAYSV